MVVARCDEAHRALAAAVRRREVERVYLALADGRIGSRTGTIDAPIGRASRSATGWPSPAPRRARRAPISRSARSSRPRPCSRPRSRPGAPTRSAPTSPRSATRSSATPTYGGPARHGLERQFLHAHRLSFAHPVTGEEMRFSSELPAGPGEGARAGPQLLRAAPAPHPSRIGPAPIHQPPPPDRVLPSKPLGPAQGAGSAAPHEKGASNGRSRHQGAAAGRSPLRPPDAPLEPEHAPLHLRRARRDPHHRPPADRAAARRRPPLRRRALERWRNGALRRHQEAGSRLRQGVGRPLPDALRQPPLARRPADQLQHDLGPDKAPARADRAAVERPARAASDQGADGDAGRAGKARVQPRRGPRYGAAARRRVRDRPEDRGDRRPRGRQAADPDHRPGRHQLRPVPGRLRRPRQRRRDPLLRAGDQHGRRRDRRGRRGVARRGGASSRRGGGAAPDRGRGASQARGGGEGAPGGRGGRRQGGRRGGGEASGRGRVRSCRRTGSAGRAARGSDARRRPAKGARADGRHRPPT